MFGHAYFVREKFAIKPLPVVNDSRIHTILFYAVS